MARKTRRRKKGGSAGFWILEAIVIIGFAIVFLNARSIRQAAMESEAEPTQVTQTETNLYELQSTTSGEHQHNMNGWQNHRPRFSTVVGDLWESGF